MSANGGPFDTCYGGQGPGWPMSLTFNGNNQISSSGYTYDAAGNLVMDNLNCYTYDAENRLSSVAPETTPGSDVCGATTMSYLYDPDGRRVARLQNGAVVKQYYYDAAGHMITEANASGNWLRAEIYAGDRHLATWTNNATYFNHADWLGTERARSNSSGARCETITSLPFGDGQTTAGSCGDPSPNHFTGLERDVESGLDHTLNRQYPSNLGRWLTPDPAGLMAVRFESPQTWNMYAYVGNNPLTLTDPSGESWFTHIMDLLWLPWWTPHQAVGDPPPETPPPPSILIPPPGPPKWKYSQTTGQLSVSILGKDTKVGKPGYAGHNEGLNNAANQYVAEDPKDPANDNAGPLPQAMYFIGKLQDNVTGTGKVLAGSMRLTPEPGAQMHEPGTDTEDRGGFLFHGGNFVTMGSSQGCIVERPPVRYTVGNSGIFELQVVP